MPPDVLCAKIYKIKCPLQICGASFVGLFWVPFCIFNCVSDFKAHLSDKMKVYREALSGKKECF